MAGVRFHHYLLYRSASSAYDNYCASILPEKALVVDLRKGGMKECSSMDTIPVERRWAVAGRGFFRDSDLEKSESE